MEVVNDGKNVFGSVLEYVWITLANIAVVSIPPKVFEP